MTLLRRCAPAIAALVGLVALWAVRPGVVENAARSPLAWAVILGTFLAGIGLRVVARRLGASPRVAQALGTGLIVVLVGAVLAPSFQQRSLVEDLPDVLTAAAGPPVEADADARLGVAAQGPAVAPGPAAPTVSTGSSTGSTPVGPDGAARSRPSSGVAAGAAGTATQPPRCPAQQPAAQPTQQPTAQPAAQPTQQPASSAEVDRSGPLKGIGHSASGTIFLRTASGKAYVVFSDVTIEGTVDPSVHLVPDGRRTPSGGVRLGKLKAEKGTFSYELPAGVDPTQRWSVLVWCDPYDTPIAAADPR